MWETCKHFMCRISFFQTCKGPTACVSKPQTDLQGYANSVGSHINSCSAQQLPTHSMSLAESYNKYLLACSCCGMRASYVVCPYLILGNILSAKMFVWIFFAGNPYLNWSLFVVLWLFMLCGLMKFNDFTLASLLSLILAIEMGWQSISNQNIYKQ